MSPIVSIKRMCLVILLAGTLISPVLANEPQNPDDAPPWSMADKYWGADVMARSRNAVQAANGSLPNYMFLADRLELRAGDNADALLWDVQAWYGGDIDKFYFKSEGEYSTDENEFEEIELQGLWSRAISPFWDVQAGLRYDLEPKGKAHAVLGMQGLAPYWFEVDAAAFLSTDGDLTARIETEYELLLTQRLILQPRGELAFSAQDIPLDGIGAGLSDFSAGLRLRYEFKREFAPYIGVEWQTSLGETADFARANGNEPDNASLILGLRAWF